MNNLPPELLSNILSHLTIRDIASLSSTNPSFQSELSSMLHLLYFDLNITLRSIISVIDSSIETCNPYKLQFIREPFIAKLSLQFPTSYKLSIHKRFSISATNSKVSHITKNKMYFTSVKPLLDTIKHLCLTDHTFSNVVVFPDTTKLK